MALSYFTESEAPRDFRISSTESEGHYTKCLLCYTVKKNFYCPDCIRTGNFVHSSMPYTDRFSEKQSKLLRLKANRKHILDRAEKLLANKLKKDSLMTEVKQSKDKLDLLRLAIEQRKVNIDEKKKQLTEITQYNTELRLKLPRYQKRVSSLEKHAASQRLELHNRHGACADRAGALAALRRSRVRQLNKYIFPVYISLDTSDSIEDMEFVGGEPEEPTRTQLHIVAPWLSADGDHSRALHWAKENKEAALTAEPAEHPLHRTVAALGLAAQLAVLLAWTLDARLPHALSLSEYCNWRVSSGGLAARAARLCAGAGSLCVRAGLPPPPPPALSALHTLAAAAAADDPSLGRVEAWTSDSLMEAAAAWGAALGDAALEQDPPEHLHWPENEEEEPAPRSPPAPAASLVTSAAASLAHIWRGWTK